LAANSCTRFSPKSVSPSAAASAIVRRRAGLRDGHQLDLGARAASLPASLRDRLFQPFEIFASAVIVPRCPTRAGSNRPHLYV
jgi:hypothetical protein